jgi:hypothetical protein
VFNPINANMPSIQFNGQVMNQGELEFIYNTAQQNLNPDPMNLTASLLIGMEKLQERVRIDKEVCEGIVKQLEDGVCKPNKEIEHLLESETHKKIRLIQQKNFEILKRVIGFEKKLFCIARKLKRVDVNLETKMRVMSVLKEMWKQTILINKNIADIRQMIDGRCFPCSVIRLIARYARTKHHDKAQNK